MTLSITTLIITTLSITTLGILHSAQNALINKYEHVLNDVMLSAIMPSFTFSYCYSDYQYAEHAECHMLAVTVSYHNAELCDAECCYAQFCCAECRILKLLC
jgi:hypothetical protein